VVAFCFDCVGVVLGAVTKELQKGFFHCSTLTFLVSGFCTRTLLQVHTAVLLLPGNNNKPSQVGR
jgi:hypothetical protein